MAELPFVEKYHKLPLTDPRLKKLVSEQNILKMCRWLEIPVEEPIPEVEAIAREAISELEGLAVEALRDLERL